MDSARSGLRPPLSLSPRRARLRSVVSALTLSTTQAQSRNDDVRRREPETAAVSRADSTTLKGLRGLCVSALVYRITISCEVCRLSLFRCRSARGARCAERARTCWLLLIRDRAAAWRGNAHAATPTVPCGKSEPNDEDISKRRNRYLKQYTRASAAWSYE